MWRRGDTGSGDSKQANCCHSHSSCCPLLCPDSVDLQGERDQAMTTVVIRPLTLLLQTLSPQIFLGYGEVGWHWEAAQGTSAHPGDWCEPSPPWQSPFRHFSPTKLAHPLRLQLNVCMPLLCFWLPTTFYHSFWCFDVWFTVQLQFKVWVFSKWKQTNNKSKCKSSQNEEMLESKTHNEGVKKSQINAGHLQTSPEYHLRGMFT